MCTGSSVANLWGRTLIAEAHLCLQDSYVALEAALRELGAFYSKQGPRAIMPDEVKWRVLGALSRADDAL